MYNKKRKSLNAKKIPYIILICLVIITLLYGGIQSLQSKRSSTNILNIVAAASLTDSFNDLKKIFEQKNEGVKVQLTFAGSQDCVAQIKEGGGFDIFASANEKYMEDLINSGYVKKEDSIIFAKNELTIILNNKIKDIDSLEKLSNTEYNLIIGDDSVPVGKYTNKMLEQLKNQPSGKEIYNKIVEKIVSKENNVKNIVAKVVLGEADAGIVYKTDITKENKDKIIEVPLPKEINVVATYPLAVLQKNNHKTLADDWIELVTSEKGKMILSQYGFIVE